jgi:hypothetical protein
MESYCDIAKESKRLTGNEGRHDVTEQWPFRRPFFKSKVNGRRGQNPDKGRFSE